MLATYLSSLGLNVLAGVLQSNYQDLITSKAYDDDTKIKLLADRLAKDIKKDARLRVELGKCLGDFNSIQIAEEIVKGNPATHGWLLLSIYQDVSKYSAELEGINEYFHQVTSHLTQIEQEIAKQDTLIHIQDNLNEVKRLLIKGNNMYQREPMGIVPLGDVFYVERVTDRRLFQIINNGSFMATIKGSFQTGKSSLLLRAVEHAKEIGYIVVLVDFTAGVAEYVESLDSFLFHLAITIGQERWLSESSIRDLWASQLSPQQKFSKFLETHILAIDEKQFLLCIDEANLLIQTKISGNFFSMLRSLHHNRAYKEIWRKFSVILSISTEPYLLIDDPRVSPFNIGETISLQNFNSVQLKELNARYGMPLDQEQLNEMELLLSGHPYLTRKAFHSLISNGMTWKEIKETSLNNDGVFGEHLQFYAWLISRDYSVQQALRDILRNNYTSNLEALQKLQSAGIIVKKLDKDEFRCSLYKKYFEKWARAG